MSSNGKLAQLQQSRVQSGTALAQQGNIDDRPFVSYMDLGQGLNTRKDSHALERNELAVLINAWYAQGQSLGKRPGLMPWVTIDGATGIQVQKNVNITGIKSMVGARFSGQTYLVIQDSNNAIWAALSTAGGLYSWVNIGDVEGGTMRGAQMYDPLRQTDCLFIVTGADIPQVWTGPGATLKDVNTSPNHLPTKANSTTIPITPAYVATLGNNSHLFYAGEPSAPSAVYVSDPFFPESFSTPLTQVNPMQGAYNPALIGNNDGVDGGAITGLQTLGSAMIVFKESAVYVMSETQLFGDTAFFVENISSSVGCLSPRSIQAMDGFVCFLGIDGVYATDGNTAYQISGNVPTYFDSTVQGNPASIANRTTAIAFRHGTRYIIFFDTGTTFADTGVWFDFAVQADQGLPGTGQINFSAPTGSTPVYLGGAVTLRGPLDDGNIAIAAANFDLVAKFGLGFSDLCQTGGRPVPCGISVSLRGKADFFEDVFGQDAPACYKNVDQIFLYISLSRQGISQTNVTFGGAVITDVANAFPIVAQTVTEGAVVGPRWGSIAEGGSGLLWGTTLEGGSGALWTLAPVVPGLYFSLPMISPQASWGKIIQMEFDETSTFGYNILGYSLQIGKAQAVA